jgi:hypothetical protein
VERQQFAEIEAALVPFQPVQRMAMTPTSGEWTPVVDPAPITFDFWGSAVTYYSRRMAYPDTRQLKIDETNGLKESPPALEPRVPQGASHHEASSTSELSRALRHLSDSQEPKAGAGLLLTPVFDPRGWIQFELRRRLLHAGTASGHKAGCH